MKTFVIGLDAATWSIMSPLLKQNKLPNIKALMDEGAWGTLRSTIPPMTPLAWTSIITGVNPGKHGIYNFVTQDRKTYRVSPVNYSHLIRVTIWDIFNAYGRKVGVINFPLAFPPPKIDTFFISGITSPESETYAYPAELYNYLKSKGYHIHPRFGPKNGAKRYLDEIKLLTETQCQVTIELMNRWECELFWVVFQGLDWIQHYLWNVIIDGKKAVETFYCYMDYIIGRLLKEIRDNWNIIILSDHGFREIKAEIHLNNLLEEWGYLKRAEIPDLLPKKNKNFFLRTGWKLGRKLPFVIKQRLKHHIPDLTRSNLHDLENEQLRLHKMINWTQTKAFSYGYMGRIYIHERGKYSKGNIESGNEYEKLREEIIAHLRSLKDPETEKPVFGKIYRKEEIYTGDQLKCAPDLILEPSDFAYMIYGDFGSNWYHHPESRIADHDMEGILIMNGKDIRKGITVNAKSFDVTPTLLYLHGLPVLEDMDGNVLQEALKEELIMRRKAQTMKTTIFTNRIGHEYSKAEQQEIEKRLRELGYL